MEQLTINLNDALSKEYKFRRAGKGWTVEIVVPRLALEREARRRNMALDQFLQSHSGQWFFDGFDGLLLRVKKSKE